MKQRPSFCCLTTVAGPPVVKMCWPAPAGAAGLCSVFCSGSNSKSLLRNDQTTSLRLPVVSCCVMKTDLQDLRLKKKYGMDGFDVAIAQLYK